MQDLTRTVFTGDNLDVMRGMNSNSVDLIYLDPPFNSNKSFSAPIGSKAEGAKFDDTWKLDSDNDDPWEFNTIKKDWHGEIAKIHPPIYELILASKLIHGESMMAYLIFMGIRLIEMKRILANHGSIYLHCDPTASHYLKAIMDGIFGRKNFRNEIIWFYDDSPGRSTRYFPRKHDTLICYAKEQKQCYFNGDGVRIPIKQKSVERYKSVRVIGGTPYLGGESATKGKIPEDVWKFPVVKKNAKESTGYPTQKPLALLKRIITASSDVDDIVFDPFCGCATALVAAELEARRWIGIDISDKAVELLKQRLTYHAKDLLYEKEFTETGHTPVRTDKEQQKIEQKEMEILVGFEKLPHYTEHKPFLYGKQRGNCNGCLRHLEYQNLEVDHIHASRMMTEWRTFNYCVRIVTE